MFSVIRNLMLLFSITMFILGLVFSNLNVLLISICSVLFHNVFYALEQFSTRIIFFAFNITFFTFLLGRIITKPLTGFYDPYNNNFYGLDFNNVDTIRFIFISLFISLLFIYIGYSLVKDKGIKTSWKYSGRLNVYKVAFFSKYLFYFTFIFNVVVLLEKVKFSSDNGYMELYSSYATNLPYLFVKISEMAPIAFFVFLATFPTKRKSLLPILLYIFLGVLSLLAGYRNTFILNIMIILIYYCLRNISDKEKLWFGKKEIITCIISFPIIIMQLNVVSYIRVDENVNRISMKDTFSEFFYKQGTSVNLIGYSETLSDVLPDDKNYTFGKIIDLLNNNIISQKVFNIEHYSPQTIESAKKGTSFADSISYTLDPYRYKNGWGYGSSYIAELNFDFGILGIIIGNIVLGMLLASMTRLFTKGILGAWLCLNITRAILYAPRSSFSAFIVDTFNLINLITIFIIFVGSLLLQKRGNLVNLNKTMALNTYHTRR